MTAADPADGENAVSSPGSLIVTFAGLYLRKLGGWIAVADLITLLQGAGQSPASVRQALVRLKSRGFLAGERRCGQAGYLLTDAGTTDLAIGDARIFRYGEARDADGWVLAVFSVPEHARAERHRLRTRLAWLGFGTVGAGVWIAPATLAERSRAELQAHRLDGYVTWFAASPLQRAEVDRWWDLDRLRTLYSEFLQRWSTAGEPPTEQAAFAAYLSLVDAWRRFPRIDPGLPASLLPADWQGRAAFNLFCAHRTRWSAPAWSFVRSSLSTRLPRVD